MKLTKKAQNVLSKVNNGEDIMDIEEAEEWSCSDGLWYGLQNGYIEPKDILIGKDLKEIERAIKLLEEFENLLEDISYEM